MDNRFSFQVEQKLGLARAGVMNTPHGSVQTPMFMPVGTLGSVKSMDSRDLREGGAQIILGNTYHLYLRPGEKVLSQAGGLHKFMNWSGPILTDSGGFQVFSLGQQAEAKRAEQLERDQQTASNSRKSAVHKPTSDAAIEQGDHSPKKSTARQPGVKITDSGVEFISHLDGSKHFFSPTKVMEIQRTIGADIIMAFDECTPDEVSESYAASALAKTQAWAHECVGAWEGNRRMSEYGLYQALFGIIQGARFPHLRRQAAEFIALLPFDGIAIGGETIGYNMAATREVVEWIRPYLPSDKPLYTMGLGLNPQDIIDAVWLGIDIFDCVGPTRLARNGGLYCGRVEFGPDDSLDKPTIVSQFPNARLNIATSQFESDAGPIQSDCDCATCRGGYSRSYLRHLYKTKELSYYRLASIHNVRFMIRLVETLRARIMEKG